MIPNRIVTRFQDDNRAVAPLIGFIFLFGFLVIAFIGYQAQVVPQQNAETEFEHFEENRYELIELKNAIMDAGSSSRAQYPTVQLGTTYRTRTLALNGPPPAGLLQTSEPYNITISNEDGVVVEQIQTRFIEYQPGYNELNIGSTWYEHSVLYLDDRDRGGGLNIIDNQDIVSEDGNVKITALQNSYQETSTGRVTLEVFPTNNFSNSDIPDEDNLTVTIPTRLDADDYWNETLENTGDTYQGVDNGTTYGNDTYALNLNVDSDDLRVNTVGIETEPGENPVTNIDQTANIRVEPFDEVGDHTWNVPDGVDEVEVLVVAGGGSGGNVEEFNTAGGGGGGAGGVVYNTSYPVTPGETIDITVGEGGDAPDNQAQGNNGGNSEFDSVVAFGGGGGAGGDDAADKQGNDGGSGGGSRIERQRGDENAGGEALNDNPGSGEFGNNGGDGIGEDGDTPNDQGAGGGGGAGEPGSQNDDEDGGNGGDGKYFGDRFGDENVADDGWVAAGGGGGGGTDTSTGGSGGQGGGGDGTVTGGSSSAGNGEPNTGSGGGGGGSSAEGSRSPGAGGSGVVVIRWSQ